MRSIIIALATTALLCSICTCVVAQGTPGVEIHGYMQNRVYLAPGSSAQFRSERISISAAAALPEESRAFVEVYYHPWAPSSGLYLESAYYDRQIGPGRLRAGKGRRVTFGMTPAWPNRKTSNYGIVSETFTQDRIQGVQYYVQQGVLDAGLSVHQAYRLGTRSVGEIPGDSVRNATNAVPHLAFRDLPGDLSRKLEVSGRLGGRWQNGLSAGVSASFASLDPRDLTNLTSAGALAPGGTTPLLPVGTTNNDRSVIGLDATYRMPGGFVAQGEWYDSSISDLDVSAWNVLVGYEPPSGWKFFARYSDKNVGAGPTDNPLSWDVRQTSLSMVQPLGRGLWLQYEYEINDERPPAGISKVNNNLFFVELFTAF